jgi:hypothetical protein
MNQVNGSWFNSKGTLFVLVDVGNCSKFFDADVAERLKALSTKLATPPLDINNPNLTSNDLGKLYIGEATAQKILNERTHGPFTSQENFMDRMRNYPNIRKDSLDVVSQQLRYL